MNAARRLGIASAVLAGLSLSVLWLTYVRPPLTRFLSQRFMELGATAASAEIGWIGGGAREERVRRLGPRLAERRMSDLKNPDVLLLGAHDGYLPESVDGLLSLERSLGRTMLIVQLYAAWGDGKEHAFPLRAVSAIWATGSVPLITWEPWLGEFDSASHEHLRPAPARDERGLADIAAGHYDFYVDAWAQAAAKFGKPLYLRFAHEMNDGYRYPWGPRNNPDPSHYVAAFRHVVARFRQANAHNVLFVWAPSVSYAGYDERYPGNDSVDWVGTGVLNYGNALRWSRWQSLDEILRGHYERLAAHQKPIMIAEFGTLAAGGNRADWYERALTTLPAYASIKAVVFFHVQNDKTVTHEALSWSFADDGLVANAIRRGLAGAEPGAVAPGQSFAEEGER